MNATFSSSFANWKVWVTFSQCIYHAVSNGLLYKIAIYRESIVTVVKQICKNRNIDTNIERHLTHWGRMTHICVSKLAIIGSDNGLSPDRRQAIIWTNAGILLIGPLGTNFNEILIEILTFSFKKMRFKVSSAKRRPFCLGLNVLKTSLKAFCLGYCYFTKKS